MDKNIAKEILAHLKQTRQAFCFINGSLVSRSDCRKALGIELSMKDYE